MHWDSGWQISVRHCQNGRIRIYWTTRSGGWQKGSARLYTTTLRAWYCQSTSGGDEYGQSLCPEITKADSFTSLQHQYHIALSTRSHWRRAQMHYTASRINSASGLWLITSNHTSIPHIPISGTQQHLPILLLPLFPKLWILATVFPLFSLYLRFKKNQGLFYILACLIYLWFLSIPLFPLDLILLFLI